jgi:hypothetical protein
MFMARYGTVRRSRRADRMGPRPHGRIEAGVCGLPLGLTASTDGDALDGLDALRRLPVTGVGSTAGLMSPPDRDAMGEARRPLDVCA